ncbi:hypothetical protein C2G38_2169098 [Gigaspora rosea]|uniref:Uncharacterized protein n=1 Tax=Gigaspora rosea TaxID=44941 RepID=A0A397VZ16_9GLOM|nr:hypothetical protein C2G38_2169098 [Gigaspora rosea]
MSSTSRQFQDPTKKFHKNVGKGKARKTNPQDLYKTTSDTRQFTKSNPSQTTTKTRLINSRPNEVGQDKPSIKKKHLKNEKGSVKNHSKHKEQQHWKNTQKLLTKTPEKNAKPFQKNAEDNPTKRLEKTQDQSTRSSARPPHKTTSDARSVHEI